MFSPCVYQRLVHHPLDVVSKFVSISIKKIEAFLLDIIFRLILNKSLK